MMKEKTFIKVTGLDSEPQNLKTLAGQAFISSLEYMCSAWGLRR